MRKKYSIQVTNGIIVLDMIRRISQYLQSLYITEFHCAVIRKTSSKMPKFNCHNAYANSGKIILNTLLTECGHVSTCTFFQRQTSSAVIATNSEASDGAG